MDVVNNLVKTYRSLAQIPNIIGAKIVSFDSNSNLVKVLSKWSERNIEKGEIIKFKKHHILNIQTGDVLFESMPIDVSQEILSKSSKLKNLNCIIRETKEDNKKKQYLEIWNKEGLCKNFFVNAFDLHGDIYCDGEFGSLDWSPNDDKIIYIAEKKIKSQAFYKQKSKEEKNLQEKFLEGDDTILGDEFLYRPDWGEQLVGKHHPVIVVCNLTTETLKVLDGIPVNFSPGQIFWSKDGKSIFGIVLETEPRRLGLIYCTNRIGYVFQLTLEGEFKILSDTNKSVSSPRISPDGANLFWLQRPARGAHGGCYELIKFDLTLNKSEVMINIVSEKNDEFSGLFMHNLPVRCFSNDGKKLFFSTLNRNRIMSYSLNLETKHIQVLETGDGSSTILDVHEDIIIISSGTLQQPSALRVSKFILKNEWIPLTKSNIICENSVLKEFEFNSEDNHSFKYYNAFYYGPSPNTSEEKIPLIVYPHGGPHSATINEFWLEPTFFVSLGFGVLMVNYRGSTGVGQNGVDFLLGKVGDTDVKDNHNAVLNILKNVPYLDSKNIFLFGKSHGGFLVGHLSAQYPDFYRAVVNLNGVTDILAMYTMSDIPDWSTSESGLVFNESRPLSLSDANIMLSKSPIQLADKIQAPTLFLIGKNDLRVPYYQGIKLYNALKSRKVKVRLNLYEDNHSLASVPVHIDCTIHSVLWFLENKV